VNNVGGGRKIVEKGMRGLLLEKKKKKLLEDISGGKNTWGGNTGI